MQKKYEAPELKLAGETENVVLGGSGIGVDMFGEDLGIDMEFETDEEPAGRR
jgi:hypothetical protein